MNVTDKAQPTSIPDGVLGLPLLLATLTLAFCSIVYELLLGQTLSAFLGNTVLRYSVTIGLYMFSMGIGALIASRRILAQPARSLQILEIVLSLLGGLSVPLVFLIDAVDLPVLVLSGVAHGLIIVIGILTGLEIPLLIEVRSGADKATSRILGVDYIGAFIGTLAFALWFYPGIGILATALIVASLNALVGMLLPLYLADRFAVSKVMMVVQGVILLVLLIALVFYPELQEAGIGMYIG